MNLLKKAIWHRTPWLVFTSKRLTMTIQPVKTSSRRRFLRQDGRVPDVTRPSHLPDWISIMNLYQEVCVTEESQFEDSAEDKASGAAAKRVNPERSLMLALAAAQTAAENGGTEIVVMDMSSHTAIFDYFVIATGTSRRQLHAISEEIDHKLEDELNDKRMNIDGYDDSRWIVLDYSTVVIHLFDEDTRAFYSLEALWADAKKVDLTETLKNIR